MIFAVIEGVYGDDPITYTKGAAIYNGQAPSGALLSSGYEWIPALIALPSFAAMNGEPLRGDITASSTALQIRRTDTLAKRLLARTRRYPKYLQSAISSTATSIVLAQTTAVTVGSVLYIGDECVVVTTDHGGGTLTVVRGVLGTKKKAHPAGLFVSVNSANTIELRRVELFEVLSDGVTIKQRWEGLVDRIDVDKMTISVTTRTSMAFSGGNNINRDAVDLSNTGDVWFAGRKADDDGTYVDSSQLFGSVFFAGIQEVASRVFKPSTSNNKPCAMRVGEALTIGLVRGTTEIEFVGVPALLGSEFETQSDRMISPGPGGYLRALAVGPIREVFLVSQTADRWSEANLGAKVSATRSLPYPYHPLTIVAALLFSDESSSEDLASFNVLYRWFGADHIPFTAQGILDSITTLIESTADIKVDTVLFAWSEKPEDVWKICRSLLKQFGFWAPVDEYGRTWFAKSGLIDVSDYNAAVVDQLELARPGGEPTLMFSPQGPTPSDALTLAVGERPWSEPQSVDVTINGVSDRRQRLGIGNTTEINMFAYDAGRGRELKEVFSRLAILYAENPPRITVEVRSDGASRYGLGTIKRLPDNLPLWRLDSRFAWLVDRSGNLTADSGAEAFTGRVVSSRWQPSTGTYLLVLELTNFHVGGIAKLRAPSMVVTSAGNDGVASFLYCAGASDFGLSVADCTNFRSGDPCELVTLTGAPDPGNPLNFQLNLVGANYVKINGLIDEASAVGKVLRLSYIGVGGWANFNAYLANVARPWTYFGTAENAANDADTVSVYNGAGDFYG